MQETTLHIAIIHTPGIGHMIPLNELARRLSDEFNFTITIQSLYQMSPLLQNPNSLFYKHSQTPFQILSHNSIGGFMTHYGWNSIMESTVHGVPLIAWPLYAEQRLNSVLLVEDLEVALRVKPDEKGLIQRDQIAQYAQCLIQGEEGKLLRDKTRVLNHAANAALNKDGSSKEALGKVAQAIMNHKSIQNGSA